MDEEIAFASTKTYTQKDFYILYEDDFSSSFRKVLAPLYPTKLKNLVIEFWYKFSSPSNVVPYEFIFIHDST